MSSAAPIRNRGGGTFVRVPAIPKWLLPWLFPIIVIVGLVAVSISVLLGVLVLVALFWGLAYVRAQYLKEHPPNPELRRRNFWDFR
jgi:hypothetical protein